MDKKNLKEFQTFFLNNILDEEENTLFLDNITPAGTLKTPQNALFAHKNGYYARLTEVLGETFEGTWFALGDELFFEICRNFITATPSRHYNLIDYGAEFPDFLAKQEVASELPFITDLAKFDWLFKNVFHSKQHVALSSNKLTKIESNPELKAIFGESVHLFTSDYSIYNLWELRKDEETEKEIDINKPQSLLIYKNKNEIFVKELSKNEYYLLKALTEGQSFEVMLDGVSEEMTPSLMSLFQVIGSTGIIEKLS